MARRPTAKKIPNKPPKPAKSTVTGTLLSKDTVNFDAILLAATERRRTWESNKDEIEKEQQELKNLWSLFEYVTREVHDRLKAEVGRSLTKGAFAHSLAVHVLALGQQLVKCALAERVNSLSVEAEGPLAYSAGLLQLACTIQHPEKWTRTPIEFLDLEYRIVAALDEPNLAHVCGIWLNEVRKEIAGGLEARIGDSIIKTKPGDPGTHHSECFRSVVWFGTSHSFTPMQAAAVRILWEEWEKGTPEVSQGLLQELGEFDSRMPHLFKNHRAWGTMIIKGQTRGTYQLKGPA